MSTARIAFGPFELDPARGALLRDGGPVPLGSRAAAVLGALLAAGGRTVAKADLLAQAWPGTIVEEGNLTVQIAALRKALGPAPGGREWIVTVPRVGYRPVTAPPASDAAEPSSEPPALAVLLFQVQGGSSDDANFAEGVAEDIIAALGRFRSFAVLAGSVSFRFRDPAADLRETARELGARCVLRGCGGPARSCAFAPSRGIRSILTIELAGDAVILLCAVLAADGIGAF
jgi:DNA-binding winged helix-turn-helix (wHTH) protein